MAMAQVPTRALGDVAFCDYEGMRRAFLRQIGIPPIEYRDRFGGSRKRPS